MSGCWRDFVDGNSSDNSLRTHQRQVLAHHLVMTLYGHWPPNDLRGSGSSELRDPKFEVLGEIYQGRKPKHLQPTKVELRAFHREVGKILKHRVIWIDHATRQVVAEAIERVVRGNKYTCYACAICSNHMHLVIRRHRDDWRTMWTHLTNAVRKGLGEFDDVRLDHPVFSERPYAVYLYSPQDIRGRIEYVMENPEKEGLPRQDFEFVMAYDGWPFAKKKP